MSLGVDPSAKTDYIELDGASEESDSEGDSGEGAEDVSEGEVDKEDVFDDESEGQTESDVPKVCFVEWTAPLHAVAVCRASTAGVTVHF